MALVLKSLYRSAVLYLKIKKLFEDGAFEGITWSSLKWSDKSKFFRWWMISAGVALICVIITCVINLVNVAGHNRSGASDDALDLYINAIGCFLLWANLVHYVQV